MVFINILQFYRVNHFSSHAIITNIIYINIIPFRVSLKKLELHAWSQMGLISLELNNMKAMTDRNDFAVFFLIKFLFF